MVTTNSHLKQWNKIYLQNAYGTDDSVNETNIQQREADLDNSDDDYLDTDTNEASAANRDTMLDSLVIGIQSSTYTFTVGEGQNSFIQWTSCGMPIISHNFLWESKTIRQWRLQSVHKWNIQIGIMYRRYMGCTQYSKYILEVKTSTGTAFATNSFIGSERWNKTKG